MSGSEKIEFSSRDLVATLCRSDFSSILVDFRVCRKVCEPSEVLRMPAKTEVRPIALRVESLARCYLKKRRQSTQKSTRNRRKRRLGASRAPSGVNFCHSKWVSQATWSDSGRLGRLGERLGATKSVEVGRSGSLGRPGCASRPEAPGGNSNRDNN